MKIRQPSLANFCIILATSFFALTLTAAPLQFRITDLGLFPGGTVAAPRAINNMGDIVGEGTTSNGLYSPFLYRDGRMIDLNYGGGFGTAVDINDAGFVIGQGVVGPENQLHAFLVTPTTIIDLTEQTGLNITPYRLNQAGVVVGNSAATFEAFSWSNGVFRLLGKLHADYWSSAFGINNHGLIVGSAGAPGEPIPAAAATLAVLFNPGGPSTLGRFPGGYDSTAVAINDRGEIVGSANGSDFGYHAYVYRGGPLLDLGVLPGDFKSYAIGINNAGQILGISEGAGERTRPFLYQDGVMHDLNDLLKPHSDWDLYYASDINDNGQIVGVGYHNGLERPFLLTPIRPPKPIRPK